MFEILSTWIWPFGSTQPLHEDVLGLENLHGGRDASIDIVFVHGLGDSKGTWTSENGVNWPRDLLPKKCPTARILAFGFDTDSQLLLGGLRSCVNRHGLDLLSKLASSRSEAKAHRRPLIFVAHSLGGLIVKSALIASSTANTGNEKAVGLSTSGVIFFATPHQGCSRPPNTFADLLKRIQSVYKEDVKDSEFSNEDSNLLRLELDQFKSISNDMLITCVHETVSMPGDPTRSPIVPKPAAVLKGSNMANKRSFSLERDHVQLVRFASPEDHEYELVFEELRKMTEEGSQRVSAKWQKHEHNRDADAGRKIKLDWPNKLEQASVPLELSMKKRFVGREDYLERIDDLLQNSTATSDKQPLLIHGRKGVGKTQLAIHFAQHFHEHRPTSTVLWVDATSNQSTRASFLDCAQRLIQSYLRHGDSLELSVSDIARYLGLEGIVNDLGEIQSDGNDDYTTELVIEAVKEWLSRESNGDWLIIFDNVTEMFDVARFFPERIAGTIILTSQDVSHLQRCQDLELAIMQEQESIDLLSVSCGREILLNSDDHAAAKRIVKRLNYFPSKIAQVGSVVCTLLLPPDHPVLFRVANFLEANRDEPFNNMLELMEPRLYHTWSINLKALEKKNPDAARLFYMCSFLSNEDISDELLTNGIHGAWRGENRVIDEISELHQLTLATRGKEQASFSIPINFHGWVRRSLGPKEQKEMARQAFSTIANAVISVRTLQSKVVHRRSFERQVVPHIEASFDWPQQVVSQIDEEPSEFLSANHWGVLGSVCERQGRYKHAERFCRLAIGNTRLELPNRPDLIETVLNFGSICQKLGNYNEAKSQYFLALERDEVYLDPQQKTRAWLGLATVMNHEKEHSGAEKYLKKALHTRENLLGPIDPQTIQVIAILASESQEKGQIEEAELLRKRELLSWLERLGSGQQITMKICDQLAAKFQEQGRYSEAATLLEQTSAAIDVRLGGDHLDALRVASRLAVIYDLQGRFDEAQKLYARIRTQREKLLGASHTQTLEAYENSALSCKMSGDYKGAEKLYRTVLGRSESVCGRNHKRTLRILTSLAEVYESQHRYEEAEDLVDKWYRNISEKS